MHLGDRAFASCMFMFIPSQTYMMRASVSIQVGRSTPSQLVVARTNRQSIAGEKKAAQISADADADRCLRRWGKKWNGFGIGVVLFFSVWRVALSTDPLWIPHNNHHHDEREDQQGFLPNPTFGAAHAICLGKKFSKNKNLVARIEPLSCSTAISI
ncbi:hypothetical protein BC832DRAFT_356635 [Gaertneriomyces semiglobifer]|nr:hypothetical protein BC832DRAFT_425755 [Gaertneriomyces semiglobifer]KAI8995190.1 hypothetical protein BC832DRAFT_356635 [Gaertneriomyces semiglobifer]